MKRVLIIGSNSMIARETAKLYAADSSALFLAARDETNLKSMADDLKVRGAFSVDTAVFDATDFESHKTLVTRAMESLGGIDIVLIAYGTLPDQKSCEDSYMEAEASIKVNYLSVVSLLTELANCLEKSRSGTIAVISSVAGDRGRQSNYVYGSAKGGLSIFLEGLRGRLSPHGVSVLTIKPGFVDTPMTAHLKHGPLFASAAKVAADIYRAIEKRRNVLYTPWFWRFIMFAVCSIPDCLFKRMRI